MREIELSQSQVVLVDDADFTVHSQYRWCYRAERAGRQGYAVRHVTAEGKDRLAYLHREIMQPPPGMEVIFLNHDTLDCRRENLRVVSKKQARQHHARARSNSRSGIKGITYNRGPRTWSVDLYRDGQTQRVGTFLTLKDAQDAHREALRQENPDLHAAPERVERPSASGSTQQVEDAGSKEGSAGCCLSQPVGRKPLSPADRR
jgi:hypothetical protein